jgi:hypothetical protein
MKTIEMIAGIIAGAACLCLFLYMAYRTLQSGRALQDENTRIYDNERHVMPKEAGKCPRGIGGKL